MKEGVGQEKKRMLVICPFPQGVAAGQRLKYEQYFDNWRKQGWEIDVSCFMDDELWSVVYKQGHWAKKIMGVLRGHFRRLCDLPRIKNYDAIYTFMWVTPFGTSIMERLFRKFSKRFIYDVEDNVLVEQNLPRDQHPNPIMRFLKGTGKTRFLIREADHVITSSPFLNDFCLEINKNSACTYISSSIDTDRFLPATPYSNEKDVVIGWTGTFSSKVFLDAIEPVFKELAKRVDFKLKVIGNFDYELEGIDLEVIQWTSQNEVSDLQTFDIGVYPLPIDDWVLGKSGLKAIQYMAFGLPIVATNVGTTPMLIKQNVNGMLVKTQEEWIDALEALVKDAKLRKRLGKEARKSAVEKYSLTAIASEYNNVLNTTMDKKL